MLKHEVRRSLLRNNKMATRCSEMFKQFIHGSDIFWVGIALDTYVSIERTSVAIESTADSNSDPSDVGHAAWNACHRQLNTSVNVIVGWARFTLWPA